MTQYPSILFMSNKNVLIYTTDCEWYCYDTEVLPHPLNLWYG